MARGEQSRNLGPLLIVLFILLLSLGAHITREGRWGDVLAKFGFVRPEPSFLLDSEAVPGKVIRDFPSEFLTVVSDAEVVGSQRFLGTDAESGQERLTVKFLTEANPADMFAAYLNYFTDKGYMPDDRVKRSNNSFAVLGREGRVFFQVSKANTRQSEVLISIERAVVE